MYLFKEKNMSLAKKGRAFMESYPNCKPVDLVENCGFNLSYAKAFWYEEKRKIFNKEHLKNRPKRKLMGSNKFQEPVAKPPAQEPAAKSPPNSPNWEQNYRGAMMHVTSLEKQIVGYKAVINYLEHQIEKHYGSSV